jgi:hypothetical protein
MKEDKAGSGQDSALKVGESQSGQRSAAFGQGSKSDYPTRVMTTFPSAA